MLSFVFRNHKALFLLGILFCCSLLTFSQFKVTFLLSNVPLNHPQDSIFVAGTFNSWEPGNIGNRISKLNVPVGIELKNIPAGENRFKFTRGSWHTVECMSNGKDINNRLFNLS